MFDRVIAQSVLIPFDFVDGASDTYLHANSKLGIIKKYVSRYLRLLFSGQLGREVFKIPPNTRVLWLHAGKRNIGDALMEASGRALLKSSNVQLDLLTLPNLACVFDGDDVFENVYYDIAALDPAAYDYVLMTEFNHRTIKTKGKYFRKLPYACMFGYFYGPDRNQTMFSFAAINQIFSLGLAPEFLVKTAKPYMCLDAQAMHAVEELKPNVPFIVIAVGGIDANRTYKRWSDVLHLLNDSDLVQCAGCVVLLGSDNGLEDAQMLTQLNLSQLNVVSYVGRLDLKKSQAMVANALRFIGCDGGLMHVAHTTSTPTVAVFAGEPSHLRLTQCCFATPLQGSSDVNDLAPLQIVNALRNSLQISYESHSCSP